MNSELYGNVYNIPDKILNQISITLQKFKKINSNGKKRANNFLRERTITYQNLKRMKNYFDNLSGDFDAIEFELAGGMLMKNFVNNLLDKERKKINNSNKNLSQYGGFDNVYNKEHNKDQLVSRTNNFLTNESIDYNDEQKVVSLGLIFNENLEILLFKRAADDDWCPNLYALIGGTKDNNETPEETIIREIKEESGLEVEKYSYKCSVLKNNIVEHLFLIKPKEFNIKLNSEHSDYKFFNIEYIKKNKDEFVPDLLKYIKLIKK